MLDKRRIALRNQPVSEDKITPCARPWAQKYNDSSEVWLRVSSFQSSLVFPFVSLAHSLHSFHHHSYVFGSLVLAFVELGQGGRVAAGADGLPGLGGKYELVCGKDGLPFVADQLVVVQAIKQFGYQVDAVRVQVEAGLAVQQGIHVIRSDARIKQMSLIRTFRNGAHLLSVQITFKRRLNRAVARRGRLGSVVRGYIRGVVKILHGHKVIFLKIPFSPQFFCKSLAVPQNPLDDAKVLLVFVLPSKTGTNGIGVAVQEIFRKPPVRFPIRYHFIHVLPVGGMGQVVKPVFSHKGIFVLQRTLVAITLKKREG